jgi:hypothetical protein
VFLVWHGDHRCRHVSLVATRDLDPEDAPHEYAGSPALVKLAIDEDKCFGSASDAPGFYLVRRELPLD